MRKNLKKAFTLVEMLIVVIIIGILIAALLPKLTGAQAKARDVARQTALSQIATALTMYFNDKGRYPTAGGCTSGLANVTGYSNYMPEIPQDPQKNRIAYGTLSNGCKGVFAYTPIKNRGGANAAYVLVANVENFGKSMNFVLYTGSNTSKTYFSGSNIDLKTEIKKKCDEGVEVSNSSNSACSETNKTGKLQKTNGQYGVYVNMGG